ncbi:TPA: molecular chaperone [Enterobacter bugandensis]|nr:molecular chaperone [Enterobacter bugandensis]
MLFLLLLFFSLFIRAEESGVSLGQTRVVFKEGDKLQGLTIKNNDSKSYLVQTRVQKNFDDASPAPFIITPPLFLLNGKTHQIMRILPPTGTLPKNQESLFYITVTAIPSQDEPTTASERISVGVGFMLKFFYRPEGLTESDSCALKFTETEQGIQIDNSSAYFQTLGKLAVNGHNINLGQNPIMVPPEAKLHTTIKLPVKRVTWQVINDYGGLSSVCNQLD